MTRKDKIEFSCISKGKGMCRQINYNPPDKVCIAMSKSYHSHRLSAAYLVRLHSVLVCERIIVSNEKIASFEFCRSFFECCSTFEPLMPDQLFDCGSRSRIQTNGLDKQVFEAIFTKLSVHVKELYVGSVLASISVDGIKWVVFIFQSEGSFAETKHEHADSQAENVNLFWVASGGTKNFGCFVARRARSCNNFPIVVSTVEDATKASQHRPVIFIDLEIFYFDIAVRYSMLVQVLDCRKQFKADPLANV